jgi:hypothetical protein
MTIKIKTTPMPSIEAGNPYLGDAFNMGQPMGKNLELMFGNHADQPCPYLILVNKATGERMRLTIEMDGIKTADETSGLYGDASWVEEILTAASKGHGRFHVHAYEGPLEHWKHPDPRPDGHEEWRDDVSVWDGTE